MFTRFHRFFFRFPPAWVCGLRVSWALRKHQMHFWRLSSAFVPSARTLCTHRCRVNQNVVSEDELETDSESVPLMHTKTWMWMCPRGWLTKRELVRLSQDWGLCSMPFQHPALKSAFPLVPSLLPDSAPALLSQGAMHFVMSVDTLHLPLSCLRLAQSGVLPPAVRFTDTWNDRDTKLTLWHLNCALGVKKEKNQLLLLNPQLSKDLVWHSFLSQGPRM